MPTTTTTLQPTTMMTNNGSNGGGVGGDGNERPTPNNNNSSSSSSNNSSKQTTPTTPFRFGTTATQTLIKPRPSHSSALINHSSNYLTTTNSNSHHRSHRSDQIVSSSLNSSISSAFSSPGSQGYSSSASNYSSSKTTRQLAMMETPAPPSGHASIITTVTSSSVSTTPRPSSQQSTSTSSTASSSPPGNANTTTLHLLSTAVEAAVAVVPANNHNTELHQNTNNNLHQQNHNDSNAPLSEPALDLPTFEKNDDVSDIVLDVENRKLHVHRAMLVLVSPVFRAMLTSDFIERKQNVIALKDKKYDEVLEFLQCIYPPWKPLSSANVRVLLKFADEYRVDGLLRRCEDFLLALKIARDAHEQRLWAYDQGQPFCRVNELLGLANNFNLERLSRALVDYLSPRPLAWQMDGPDFFAYSGPQLENRILSRALATTLALVERNRYCDTVKELLANGHKVFFDGGQY